MTTMPEISEQQNLADPVPMAHSHSGVSSLTGPCSLFTEDTEVMLIDGSGESFCLASMKGAASDPLTAAAASGGHGLSSDTMRGAATARPSSSCLQPFLGGGGAPHHVDDVEDDHNFCHHLSTYAAAWAQDLNVLSTQVHADASMAAQQFADLTKDALQSWGLSKDQVEQTFAASWDQVSTRPAKRGTSKRPACRGMSKRVQRRVRRPRPPWADPAPWRPP